MDTTRTKLAWLSRPTSLQWLLVLISVLACLGCKPAEPEKSGEEEVKGEAATSVPAEGPGAPLTGMAELELLAAMLPGDTLAVVVGDLEAMLAAMTPGGTAQLRSSLRKDLGELLLKETGVDPLTASRVGIVAGRGQWLAFIAEGKVGYAPDLEKATVAGLEVHRLKGAPAVVFEHQGLTVITVEPMVELFLKEAGTPLAQAPQFAAMKKAIEQLEPDAALLAALVFDKAVMEAMNMDLPPMMANLEVAGLSVGQGVEVVATGPSASIKELEGAWNGVREQLVNDVQAAYDARLEARFDDALGTVLVHHVLQGLLSAYSPTFEGEVARLRLDPKILAESGSLLALGAAGTLFWGVRRSEAAVIEAPAMEAPAMPEVVLPPQ